MFFSRTTAPFLLQSRYRIHNERHNSDRSRCHHHLLHRLQSLSLPLPPVHLPTAQAIRTVEHQLFPRQLGSALRCYQHHVVRRLGTAIRTVVCLQGLTESKSIDVVDSFILADMMLRRNAWSLSIQPLSTTSSPIRTIFISLPS